VSDDCDKWIENTFTLQNTKNGKLVPSISISPIRHQTNLTPEQAARLIAHISRLIGDVPLMMLFPEDK